MTADCTLVNTIVSESLATKLSQENKLKVGKERFLTKSSVSPKLFPFSAKG